MRKIFLIFFIFFLSTSHLLGYDNIIKSLKEGDKLIFIRHALAPGNGDPENFDINICSTQRNLNSVGIEQSKKIGSIFKMNKIKIDEIYSSEWCRCKDTALYAFKNFKTFGALNSFYDIKFSSNEEKQIKDLNNFIKKIDSRNNVIFITHYVVIDAMLNIGTSSGEIVVTDKNLNIIGSIDTL